jgi:HK97 family phage prohead protease
MPMPTPKDGESKQDFLDRCMGDETMNEDYPDNDQRYAVCLSQWEKEKDSKEPDREIRTFELDSIELRAGEDDEGNTLEGHAAVFGKKSEDLGGFREIIDAGAFSAAIKRDDVRALFNHDQNYILGRNKSKTLELEEDDKGLRFKIDMPDTSYARDLAVSIERGDVSQCSFAFRIDGAKGETWEVDGKEVKPMEAFEAMWDDKKHDIVRHVVKARLYDVSPVTYPAYPQTDVKVRALEYKSRTDEVKPAGGQEAVTGPDRLGEQRLKYGYPKIKTGELK